ncbi:hypothetical protein CLHUN_12900 [Ruminiclostridium hungatei]|uniref:DUF2442 domain-containing protein n=1 Tax=Ruminiclostridium hungatei TaxID=48256 RepID=A0A1V4SME8_RUMHU|nr:hypothetical protein CLHUN_12900 [Ruminiclostridium hungatei]
MLKITRVDIIDGQTLDIELSNGHLILFDIRQLPETDHIYDSLRDLEVLPRPSTDGRSVFWRDGPRLALEEILRWLTVQKNNE